MTRSRATDRQVTQLLVAFAAGLLSGGVLCSGRLVAQTTPPSSAEAEDSITVTAGPRYGAASARAWLMGAGYREVWTTPFTVAVADLGRLGGGLTPVRLGGGRTTQTLTVTGTDGRRYVLRSVDKRVGQGLSQEFQGTIYESVLQDQISAFLPTGAPVVSALLEPLGVLHASPRFVFVPDDPRLGEFRGRVANTLTLFEERPSEGPGDSPGFADSRKIVGTDRFMERLIESPVHRLDAAEFLAARLVDIMIGDRDRSVNNWLWARFDTPTGYRWRGIPRDRDQAFIRLDGFLKKELRLYEPRLVSFEKRHWSVKGLTRSAWDMDRPLLVALSRRTWDSTVAVIQTALSDSVIEAAARMMPPEHFAVIGRELIDVLRHRRDRLDAAAAQFYRIVNEYADIRATDLSDVLQVDRSPSGVRVRLAAHTEPGAQPLAYFDRTFRPGETREVRIYLLGGRDSAVVRGRGADEVMVRMSGGQGRDWLADSAQGRGGRNRFYDGGDRTEIVRGSGTRWERVEAPPARMWGENAALPPDWGGKWDPFPALTVGGDLGLVLSGGVIRTRYGYLRSPYSHRITSSGSYASGVGRFRFAFRQRWNLRSRVRAQTQVVWSGYEVIRFHGFGNDTDTGSNPAFFRVLHEQLTLRPALRWTGARRFTLEVAPTFTRAVTDTTNTDTFVAATRPYGSGAFNKIGGQMSGTFDSRDRPVAAASGVLVTGGTSLHPPVLDVQETYGSLSGSAAVYLSPTSSGNLVLALRVAGRTNFGRSPFLDAAFLGGPSTVRGFRRQRFAGDAYVFANAELRLFVTRVSFLFPTDVGVVGMTDVGRVYVDGESPGGWRRASGGGVWFAPVDRRHTVSVVMARGQDYTGLYVRTGFMF